MPCCRDVLIRLIRAQPVPAAGHIDVLGVDDVAIRRRQSYNAILIDMDTRRPVDVLPDRESGTLAAWLREHPGVKVVCRDRAGAYAEGIRDGAPDAVQVADRFCLWKNLCEATEKTVAAHRHCPRAVAAAQAGPAGPESAALVPAAEPAVPPARPHRLAERTRARHTEVQECLARGLSRAAIARELNLDIQTARRFAHATRAEELLARAEHRSANLDPFIDLVSQRGNAGVTNAETITGELHGLGFKGSVQAVRRYLKPTTCPNRAASPQACAATRQPSSTA
jgi:DNA-binding NarL/FixJ family response regulator